VQVRASRNCAIEYTQEARGVVLNHQGAVLDSIDGYDVIECQSCGFRHLSPLPTEEETAAYYKTEYTGKRPDYIKTLEEDLEWWRLQYRKKYEVLEGMTEGRVLLDVGCGLGRFMEVGEKSGWHTGGIEPSVDSANYAKNLGLAPVWNTTFDAQYAAWNMFWWVPIYAAPHVIHSHETLEHITDPKGMLQTWANMLARDGILCLTVPNDYNPLQLALKRLGYPSYWVNKEHINYFRPSSLKLLVESVGFKVERIEMSFPMEFFLLMGTDYTKDKAQGRACHLMRKNLDFNIEEAGFHAPEAFRTLMSALNWGREVTVYARKN